MSSRNFRPLTVIKWIVLFVGIIALIYVMAFKPVDVRSIKVTRGPVLVEALGTGSIESRRTVEISFEVPGRIMTLNVDQGDSVTAGQELASIDNATFQAEVALAEQDVTLAEATLRRLGANIERSRAVIKGAQENLSRTRPLVESGAASAEALDSAEERMEVAAAELSGSQAAEIEGLQAIQAALRRLDRANVNLERTVVRSPFDGIVLIREREVGDVAAPGAPVLRLAATDTVWARVWVDETYLGQLRDGLPAHIALRSDPDNHMAGHVARVGREVDRETRELLVDVAFDQLPANLVFGQRVDLWIELQRSEDAVQVQARMILRIDGVDGVFLADGSRARFQAIRIGKRGRALVEVTEGLQEGAVVLDPALGKKKRLKDGQRIRLVEKGAGGGGQ